MAAHLLEETLTADQAAELKHYQALPGFYVEAAAAIPRPDLDSRLGKLLGIDPCRSLTRGELVNLLSGHRASGELVPGKVRVRSGRSLADTLALDPSLVPTARALEHISKGFRGDGGLLLERTPGRARTQLFSLYGVASERMPTLAEMKQMQSGCRADGTPLRLAVLRTGLGAHRQAVSYLDLTFSADKSVSITWALARTAAERAAVVQAHRDALSFVLEHVETELGRARRGSGGRGGYDVGVVAWLTFDHFTARPTKDAADRTRVAGDPQLHSHAVIPNLVLTESGRIGGLDLARMAGRVHAFGAIYHARLGTLLRQLGAEVTLDRETGAARLAAVPDKVRDEFSKRTRMGVGSARAYARSSGLEWDTLPAARRIALAKGGVQGDPGQIRTDDRSRVGDWQRQAAALGWTTQSVLQPKRPAVVMSQEMRIDHAFQIATQVLHELVRPGIAPESRVIELAAARGLVETGIEHRGEVDLVQRRFLGLGSSSGNWVLATIQGARGGEEIRPVAATSPMGVILDRDGRDVVAALQNGHVADALASKRRSTGRRQASAILVPGGSEAVVEAAMAVWRIECGVSLSDVAGPCILVPPGNLSALVAKTVRRSLQVNGALGPDLLTVPALSSDGEAYEMPLAIGDVVQLQAPTNASRVGGGSGRIGAAGSRLSVVSVSENGLRLLSTTGREGDVRWSTLQDGNGRAQLDYAYVGVLGTAPQGRGRLVIAFPESTEGFDSVLLPSPGVLANAVLLFSEDAERNGLLARSERIQPEPVAEDEVWAQISRHLAPAPPLLDARQLLIMACATERGAARAFQRSAMVVEQRSADGHAAFGLKALRARQATACLLSALKREATSEAGQSVPTSVLVPTGPYSTLNQAFTLTSVLQQFHGGLLDRLAAVAKQRQAQRRVRRAQVLTLAFATQQRAAELLQRSTIRIQQRAATSLPLAPGLRALRDRQATSISRSAFTTQPTVLERDGSAASIMAGSPSMLDQVSALTDVLQQFHGGLLDRLVAAAKQRRAQRQVRRAQVLALASATQQRAAKALQRATVRIERRAAAGLPQAPGIRALRDRQLTPLFQAAFGPTQHTDDASRHAVRVGPVTRGLERQQSPSALIDMTQILENGNLARLAAVAEARKRRRQLRTEELEVEIEEGKIAVLKAVEEFKLQKERAELDAEANKLGTQLDLRLQLYDRLGPEWGTKALQSLRDELLQIGRELVLRPDLAAILRAQLMQTQPPSFKEQLIGALQPDELLQIRFQKDDAGRQLKQPPPLTKTKEASIKKPHSTGRRSDSDRGR